MADYRVLIPVTPEVEDDIDIDLCQQVNALIGQEVPIEAGIEGRTVTDIDKIYPSQYSDKVLILANTTETP
jgi:hypothetical protein